MSWTVLNVAYPLACVGPDAIGGAEQVVARLDTALTRAGHQSLVVAAEGSRVEGRLLPTPQWTGPLGETTRRAAAEAHRNTILQALRSRAVDLIHLHGVDFDQYLPPAGRPVLITLHLPPAWYPTRVFQLERPDTFLQCVSPNQRRACPPSPLLLPEIENGVSEEFFARRHAKRSFALCLGRICPEKGFHLALEAAKQAQVPLLLGGAVYRYAAHEAYFEREIVPRLNRFRRFLGPLGFRRKARLLSAARCLLAPSLVPETSSLVAMEAMACGTPVIAFPAGALADIIDHGRTGFLVRSAEEMAEALADAGSLDPRACRQEAQRRFSLKPMTEKYFEIYRRLIEVARREELYHVRGSNLQGSPSASTALAE